MAKKITKKSVSKKTTKKKVSIIIKKTKRELVIRVENPKDLKYLVEGIQKSFFAIEMSQIMFTSKFWDWLKTSFPKPTFSDYKIDRIKDIYRICSASYLAYSIAGSISCGGRLNVGGSQLRAEFPDIKQFGALYFSEDLNTAINEYCISAPLGPQDKKYKVTLKKSFELWNYDKIVDSLKFPGIKDHIDGTPISALWATCKVPMPSQVLAFWLKNLGGDGFIFESTKTAGAKNIVLIFKDDLEALMCNSHDSRLQLALSPT